MRFAFSNAPHNYVASPDNMVMYTRSSAPGTSDGAQVGQLWLDTSTNPGTLKECTSLSPVTWTAVSGSGTVTLTGDVTGTGSGSFATTVAKINGAALGSTTATSGNILIGSGTQWVTNAVSGDGTLSSSGALTVTKTNGSSFATSATTDTTNAANISSGTLPNARLSGIYSSVTGLGSQAQALNLNSHLINNVTDPSAAQDAATKNYVDNAIAGVNPAVSVKCATTQASDTSSLTYSNGVSGIGATLTGSVNTALTFDGVTLTSVNQRVLVKNDTQSPSGAFNGVYYLTQLQTGILPPILTRALDYDQASDINNTGAIPVVSGTTNGSTSWLLTTAVTTVGTDPLTYTQFTYKSSTFLQVSNNLSDIGNASTARTNLGVFVSPLTTKGDIHSYTSTDARLAVGTDQYYVMADSSQTIGLSYQIPVIDNQLVTYFKNDFLGSANGDQVYATVVSGTGAAVTLLTTSIDNAHMGVVKLDMGTTTTGYAGINSQGQNNTLALGGATITLETCVQMNTLSNGTDTYTFYFGCIDAQPNGTINNGVYVTYNSGTNSGNFVLTAKKAGSSTTTNTSATFAAATWYKLRLVITGTSSATLYGATGGSAFASLGTVSSNLPTANIAPFYIALIKSAGTTDTFGYIDYYSYKGIFTTTR